MRKTLLYRGGRHDRYGRVALVLMRDGEAVSDEEVAKRADVARRAARRYRIAYDSIVAALQEAKKLR